MDDLAERIAKLKELLAKATPGPWQYDSYRTIFGGKGGTPEEGGTVRTLIVVQGGSPERNNDAYAIAYLRNNALPIIEALESENEKLKEQVSLIVNATRIGP